MNMREKIKIKFIDFWDGFDAGNFFIYRILNEHYDMEFSEEPDYLIYSCFSWNHLNYDKCIKIFYTGETIIPDFNLCDYAIGPTYINYEDRFFRLQVGWNSMYNHEGIRNHEKYIPEVECARRKKFCSFVYSNSGANPKRIEILEALNRYKPVSCGGKIRHNTDIPHKEGNSWVKDRLEFERDFKFAVACENTSLSGYSTEKILIAFAAGAIPIYWGDPTIKNVFNEKAFINVDDFPDLDSVVQRVKEIDENDELYRQILSEPIFVNPEKQRQIMKDVEEFLVHIVEQPLEKARRRCENIHMHAIYCNKLSKWHKLYEMKIVVILRRSIKLLLRAKSFMKGLL